MKLGVEMCLHHSSLINHQFVLEVGIMELLDVREGAALIELDHEDVDELMMLLCSR